MPVIIVSGSDYQMGYQYGQQAGQYIAVQKDASWVDAINDFGSREGVLDFLKRFQYYIKGYTPEAIEQMKGMADGASTGGYEVSYVDVLVINCRPKRLPSSAAHHTGGEEDALPPVGCSVFAAWGSVTTDKKFIFGDSKDSVFNHQVVLVAFPDNGHSYMTGVRAGELSEHFAMNNKGIFIGTGRNPAKRPMDLGYGLHKTFSIQHMLRFADNASKAKDMFLSWEFPNATNFIFADVHGHAFVVERTAAAMPVRRPGDHGETDFIYSTNNVMTDEMKEAVKGKKYVEHAGWLLKGSAIPRSLEVWNMLHNYHGKVDADFVKMMWRFNDNPSPCALATKDYSLERDQKICNFHNMRIAVGQPDNGNNGVAYICTGPAGRLLHPPDPGGRDCFQIAGTQSFYELALAASPSGVVKAAKDRAHIDIAEAYRELMMLKYTDTAYAALNGLYAQATAEYYRGVNAYNKGQLASGTEELLCFSQSATAFTRAQAHARQAYNTLVPPPGRPEDLGLRPYGGSWAEWATLQALPGLPMR
jgi:hypothetical protein